MSSRSKASITLGACVWFLTIVCYLVYYKITFLSKPFYTFVTLIEYWYDLCPICIFGVILDLLYEQNFYHTGSMHMVFHHYVLFGELQDHISEQTFYTFENIDSFSPVCTLWLSIHPGGAVGGGWGHGGPQPWSSDMTLSLLRAFLGFTWTDRQGCLPTQEEPRDVVEAMVELNPGPVTRPDPCWGRSRCRLT